MNEVHGKASTDVMQNRNSATARMFNATTTLLCAVVIVALVTTLTIDFEELPAEGETLPSLDGVVVGSVPVDSPTMFVFLDPTCAGSRLGLQYLDDLRETAVISGRTVRVVATRFDQIQLTWLSTFAVNPEWLLHDPLGKAAESFRVTSFPSTIISDARGRVVESYAGIVRSGALRDSEGKR